MKCPICGGELIWQSEFMANECYDVYEGDEEATVQYWQCSNCGRMLEITDPTKEERDTSYADYWNQTDN